MQCSLLTACLFLGGKPFSNTHTDLLSSSMSSGASPLRKTKGDMSIPQRRGGSLGMEPCPPAQWRGVRLRHGRSGWLQAGALWVGSFQPVLVAIPSSVRYDLPLCSVAEHWQTRYCHAPALVDPLWRDGEREGFTCLSSLSRWETTAHGVPEGKRKRAFRDRWSNLLFASSTPSPRSALLCPPLVSVVRVFWHSSGDNWCPIWVLGGKANEGVSMMPQPSPAHSGTRFHPHLSIPRHHPPQCQRQDPTEFCPSTAKQPQPALTELDSISLPGFPWLCCDLIHLFAKWLTATLPALETDALVSEPAMEHCPWGSGQSSVTRAMRFSLQAYSWLKSKPSGTFLASSGLERSTVHRNVSTFLC